MKKFLAEQNSALISGIFDALCLYEPINLYIFKYAHVYNRSPGPVATHESF